MHFKFSVGHDLMYEVKDAREMAEEHASLLTKHLKPTQRLSVLESRRQSGSTSRPNSVDSLRTADSLRLDGIEQRSAHPESSEAGHFSNVHDAWGREQKAECIEVLEASHATMHGFCSVKKI
ncbi:ANKRD50 [Symbiodinium sp. CCMP2592]|nr:ANKRD50 [Symbiodinium sp. CCMP2592]